MRLKPANLHRTDQSQKEGKVDGGYVMRFGEWFPIQSVLDMTMNAGEAAGEAFADLGAREQADVLSGRSELTVPATPKPSVPPDIQWMKKSD